MAEVIYRLSDPGPKHSCKQEIGWSSINEVYRDDYPAHAVILCSCGTRYFTSPLINDANWSKVHRLTIFNKMYWKARKQVEA